MNEKMHIVYSEMEKIIFMNEWIDGWIGKLVNRWMDKLTNTM